MIAELHDLEVEKLREYVKNKDEKKMDENLMTKKGFTFLKERIKIIIGYVCGSITIGKVGIRRI